MMDPSDQRGYTAWNVFYDQLHNRYGLSRGKNQYWQHKYYKAFREIGEYCLKHALDVTDFVTVCFEIVGRNHNYITPRDFTTPVIRRRYAEHVSKTNNHPAFAYKAHSDMLLQNELKLIPDVYGSEEEILVEPNGGYPAWFRVLYPEQFSELLFELYGELAWDELRRNTRLRKFLRDELPRNLRELEQRLGSFGDTYMENVE